MQNAVLHLLTNRASDFGSTIFPKSSVYIPHPENEVEKSIRSLLKLRSGDSPYFLMNIMGAIYAFPEIFAEFKETNTSFQFSDYVRPPNTVSGGSIVSMYGKTVSYSRIPNQYPIDFEITISYKDSEQVRIMVDDFEYEASYTIRGDGFLDIDWPKISGLSGIVQPNAAWSVGSLIRVYHQPVSYPYKAVADHVLKNTDYISYISSIGLLKNMHSAQTDLEKVAILGLVISNTQKYA